MNKGRYDAIVGEIMAAGIDGEEARRRAHHEETRLSRMDQDISDTAAILGSANATRRQRILYDMRGHLAAVSGSPEMYYFDGRLVAHGLRCWLRITPERQRTVLDGIKASAEPVPGIPPPGPWVACGLDIYESGRVNGPVAHAALRRADGPAIARLIVAAPRLAAALAGLLDVMPKNKINHPASVEARAALASSGAGPAARHAIAAE